MTDPWEGALQDGEVILWQARAKARKRLQWRSPLSPFFFVILTACAVAWTALSHWGTSAFFWWIGLALLGLFLWRSGWVRFAQAFKSRPKAYALTERRALIATWRGGRYEIESALLPEAAPNRLTAQSGRNDITIEAERGPVVFHDLEQASASYADLQTIQSKTR